MLGSVVVKRITRSQLAAVVNQPWVQQKFWMAHRSSNSSAWDDLLGADDDDDFAVGVPTVKIAASQRMID